MAKKTKSLSEIKAMLAAEKYDSLGSNIASKLTTERIRALEYYGGDITRDVPNITGRSQAVSSDVLDTVHGLMPGLMEVFAASDDAIQFAPVGPEDREAAEQETAYVQHVFWNKNPGFQIMHDFMFDALLSKLGVVKVWAEEEEKDEQETYYGQSEDQLAFMLAQNPDWQIIAQSVNVDEYGMPVHDVTIQRKRQYMCFRVACVPPEEFGIARRAVNIKDADYCFHQTTRTAAELIDLGYDADQVDRLPGYTSLRTSTESQSRDTVEEGQYAADDTSGVNKAMRPIEVTEHYIRFDYDGTGAKLWRVVTAGEETDVLLINGKPDIETIDFMPFAGITPFPMPHRVFGRSIADVTIEVQKIKSVVLRGLLDNTYAVNMPRPLVSESLISQSTFDDLAEMSHGAPIRQKQPGAVEWQVVPSVVGNVFPVLEYMDTTKEWRTGVTRQGQGLTPQALVNQSATAANLASTAAQSRMKLIAKIFAETGMRDMFWLLHATILKHAHKSEVLRLTNKWVQVDPRNWKARNDLIIGVGLGDGGKNEKLAQLQLIMTMQKEAAMAGLTNVVNPENLFNSAKEVCKLMGLDVEQFFSDPKDNPMPPQQPDPKMMELQGKMQIEQMQAEADIATQNKKTEAEMTLAQQKFQHDAALADQGFALQKELKLMEFQADQQARAQQAALNHEQEIRKLHYQASAKKLAENPDLGDVAAISDNGTLEVNNQVKDMLARLHDQMQHHIQLTQEAKAAALAPRQTTVQRHPKTQRIIGATSQVVPPEGTVH